MKVGGGTSLTPALSAAGLPAHITNGLCELRRVSYVTAPRHVGDKIRRMSSVLSLQNLLSLKVIYWQLNFKVALKQISLYCQES